MLFSSHQLDLVEHLCTSVAIIHHGALVADGTVEELAHGGQLRIAVQVSGDDEAHWTSRPGRPRHGRSGHRRHRDAVAGPGERRTGRYSTWPGRPVRSSSSGSSGAGCPRCSATRSAPNVDDIGSKADHTGRQRSRFDEGARTMTRQLVDARPGWWRGGRSTTGPGQVVLGRHRCCCSSPSRPVRVIPALLQGRPEHRPQSASWAARPPRDRDRAGGRARSTGTTVTVVSAARASAAATTQLRSGTLDAVLVGDSEVLVKQQSSVFGSTRRTSPTHLVADRRPGEALRAAAARRPAAGDRQHTASRCRSTA